MPSARSPLAEVLADLGRAFDAIGVDWYLFGAQAAILYGAARLSADVVVTVALGDRRVAELVAALDTAGFCARSSGSVAPVSSSPPRAG